MKTHLLAALLIAAPLPVLADKLEDLQAQGYARIAIGNEPPFTAVGSDGKVSGAAPDVTREVFRRLGVEELEASVTEYGAMIPSLLAGRVDAVSAGLFMNAERCDAVAYSEPVLCDAEAFLVPAGNPGGYQSAPRPAQQSAPAQGQVAAPTGDQDFEDRLKRFMQDSDSKMAGVRQYSERKTRSRRR